ncbi:MAG: superoxide dismutase [Prolixibacteraceae bacterium]|nr:superoxide dismutase [Prolixibacteraceae bacterium]
MSFELPKLGYDYAALEPYIDAQTVEIHYSKHHAAYTNNLNAAVKGTPWENKTIEEIFAEVSKVPVAVKNNGGGYFNHNFYWEILTPGGAKEPQDGLLQSINRWFGSVDALKETFNKAAATRFGSGWAWLIQEGDKLTVASLPNQDNPLMDNAEVKGIPLMTIDVWEHAYYLKYQNRRPDYIDAFWKLINWDIVAGKYNK